MSDSIAAPDEPRLSTSDEAPEQRDGAGEGEGEVEGDGGERRQGAGTGGSTGEQQLDDRDQFENQQDGYEPNGEPRRRLEPSVRFYISVWLPAAGALLAYGVMRGSIWADFVGLELLVVGWYTLAAL